MAVAFKHDPSIMSCYLLISNAPFSHNDMQSLFCISSSYPKFSSQSMKMHIMSSPACCAKQRIVAKDCFSMLSHHQRLSTHDSKGI